MSFKIMKELSFIHVANDKLRRPWLIPQEIAQYAGIHVMFLPLIFQNQLVGNGVIQNSC